MLFERTYQISIGLALPRRRRKQITVVPDKQTEKEGGRQRGDKEETLATGMRRKLEKQQ